jgi:hypothetical protein
MENKYYISADLENNQYVGKVFTINTNQLVYTSKPYNTKEQATTDARTFVITSAPPVNDPAPPKVITSTATYTEPRPIHGYTGRCCGR